ncbi:hypothetical protein OOT08_12545, partial [Leucobacter sp. M11]|nr:hypothetical protein [Leucobacter sp. M11]
MYAALIETGSEATVTADTGFVDMDYVRPDMMTDGSFSVVWDAPAANLDRETSYEMIVWPAHSLPTTATIYARAALAVSAEQWELVFPAPIAPVTAAVEVSAATEAGLTLAASGTGYSAPQHSGGVYAAVIETGSEAGVTADAGYVGMSFVRANMITDGAFSVVLDGPAASLDRNTSYEMIVWPAHSLPTTETIFARAPLSVSAEQWETVFPAPVVEPKVAFSVQASAAGLTVPVTGTGFTKQAAGDGVYVAVIKAGQAMTVESAKSPAVVGVTFMSPKAPAGRGLAKDGSFSTTIDLPQANLVSGEPYEVLVWNAHGVVSPESLVSVEPLPVSAEQWETVFPTPVAERVVSTSVGAIVQNDTMTFSVTGSGYPKENYQKGLYASVIEAGTSGELSQGNVGLQVAYIPVTKLTTGTFTADIVVNATKLDNTKQYEIAVWRAQTNPSDQSADLETSGLAITDEHWAALFPKPAVERQVTAQVGAISAKESIAVEISGTGYPVENYSNGVYVSFIEAGTADELSQTNMGLTFAWVKPSAFEQEGFRHTLTVPASKINRMQEYEIVVWRGHTLPADENADLSKASLTISEANWDMLFPKPAPKVSATVGKIVPDTSVAVSVAGVAFPASEFPNGVYAALVEKGTILDQTMPNFGLKYEWVRATGADGTFTSVLSVPADKLDRSKEYEVAVWRGHTMPAMPTSNLTVVPVEFSTANWDMLFP